MYFVEKNMNKWKSINIKNTTHGNALLLYTGTFIASHQNIHNNSLYINYS